MNFRPCLVMLATCLTLAQGAALAANAFAPADAKATLNVEYVYEAKGESKSPGDSKRWERRRVTRIVAEMVALPAAPLPSLHVVSATQSADMERRGKAGEAVAVAAAPGSALMMDAMEQAISRCGDDENCVAKVMMKSGVLADPRVQQSTTAARTAARDVGPMQARYQIWSARKLSGSYEIAETEHHEFLDQQCPKLRCTADTVTQGKGAPPPPKVAGMPAITQPSLEMDMTGASIIVALPAPMAALPVTRVVSSTLAAGKPHSPAGRFAEERSIADGLNPERLQITVPLKGTWRNQSGETVIPSAGGGKLIARWRFVAQ